MKSVYLVKERSIINGRESEFYGIAYYSSYKKALQDYKSREKQRESFYPKEYERPIENLTLKTHEVIFLVSENNKFQLILEQHEVY